MGEICEVCGRELSGRRDPLKYPDQCWRGLNSNATRECFERGYQRLTEALAAARRELADRDSVWAAAVRRKLAPHYPCRVDDVKPCPECAPLRALLKVAAPAAGEEGK